VCVLFIFFQVFLPSTGSVFVMMVRKTSFLLCENLFFLLELFLKLKPDLTYSFCFFLVQNCFHACDFMQIIIGLVSYFYWFIVQSHNRYSLCSKCIVFVSWIFVCNVNIFLFYWPFIGWFDEKFGVFLCIIYVWILFYSPRACRETSLAIYTNCRIFQRFLY